MLSLPDSSTVQAPFPPYRPPLHSKSLDDSDFVLVNKSDVEQPNRFGLATILVHLFGKRLSKIKPKLAQPSKKGDILGADIGN